MRQRMTYLPWRLRPIVVKWHSFPTLSALAAVALSAVFVSIHLRHRTGGGRRRRGVVAHIGVAGRRRFRVRRHRHRKDRRRRRRHYHHHHHRQPFSSRWHSAALFCFRRAQRQRPFIRRCTYQCVLYRQSTSRLWLEEGEGAGGANTSADRPFVVCGKKPSLYPFSFFSSVFTSFSCVCLCPCVCVCVCAATSEGRVPCQSPMKDLLFPCRIEYG